MGLTELGVLQARAAARACRALGAPVRVVSSPLGRCLRTAEELGLAVEVDERWIEMDYGEYDGQLLAEVAPATWQRWRTERGFAPPGGESLEQVGARVRDACEALCDDAAEGVVIVVTHVSPIKAAVAWALQVGDDVAWRLYVAPASISRIAVTSDGASLQSFNEVAHLATPSNV